MRKILIATPIRGREWCLNEFFEGLRNLDVTDCDVEYFFLLQGYSPVGLNAFVDERRGWNIRYEPELELRAVRPWHMDQYKHLARIRNCLISAAICREADLFSIDSDIIPSPDVLQRLIAADKDIVSALVNNHPTVTAFNVMMLQNGRFTRDGLDDLHDKGLIECDLTGACYLIKYEVLKAGVRYSTDKQGEDAGLCRDARKHGFELWVDANARTVHRYAKGLYLT